MLNFTKFTADMLNQEFLKQNNFTLINDFIFSEEEMVEIFKNHFNISNGEFEVVLEKNIGILTLLREALFWIELKHRENGSLPIQEYAFFQPLFQLFLQALINDFPSITLNVTSATTVNLQCAIRIEEKKGNFILKNMRGFTDVFVSSLDVNNIVEDEVEELEFNEKKLFDDDENFKTNNMLKILNCVSFIELKAPFAFAHTDALKPKGQLFLQTEAIGNIKEKNFNNQNNEDSPVTMSLLTDLFAITLCVKVEKTFYMESRVMLARSYLVRILFSLCSMSKATIDEHLYRFGKVKVVDEGKPKTDTAKIQKMKDQKNVNNNQKLNTRSDNRSAKNDENNTKRNYKNTYGGIRKNDESGIKKNDVSSSNRKVLGVLTESTLNRWNNYLAKSANI
jgi:hypothetical protein